MLTARQSARLEEISALLMERGRAPIVLATPSEQTRKEVQLALKRNLLGREIEEMDLRDPALAVPQVGSGKILFVSFSLSDESLLLGNMAVLFEGFSRLGSEAVFFVPSTLFGTSLPERLSSGEKIVFDLFETPADIRQSAQPAKPFVEAISWRQVAFERRKAARRARASGNIQVLLVTLVSLAEALLNAGEFPETLETLQQALALGQTANDRAAEGRLLGNIAGVYQRMSLFSHAKEYHRKALEIHTSVGAAAPEFGQHTEEVLTQLLGYSWDDIARLKDARVI